ncbi:MAG: M1 family aminopeptidase [Senegalia sp. (in: firmicutes)]|uniref:M1 family aminopeptidase n=1 Tax=Senegalia sp. (in: firmicutes) TaxID=1924098 RepID=UPI003F9D3915
MIIEKIIANNKEIIYEETKIEKSLPFFPEAKIISILNKTNIKSIEIKYSGIINRIQESEINSINDDFIELNLYSPWYPLIKSIPKVKYNVLISGIPDYYLLEANKVGDNWSSNIDSMDCYLLAMKNYSHQSIKINNMKVGFYSINKTGNKIVECLVKYVEDILNFYNHKFGSKALYNEFNILVAPRVKGGGYCREKLIVLSERDIKEKDLIHFIGHEMAHIWWNEADASSWEDWLNESFAEYSSWLYIEHYFGKEKYKAIIDYYEKETINCPAIMNMDRNDSKAYLSRFKGALILHEFRNTFGDDELKELFAMLNKLEIKYTEELINKIKIVLGKNQADFIYNKLSLK